MDKLNETLEKLNTEYNMSQKTINQKEPARHFDNNENQMNIQEMVKSQIDNTNKINAKFNSFLTDKEICVNNPYYNLDNQPSSINTRKQEILNNNTTNKDYNNDPNSRLSQFQFQHYDKNINTNQNTNQNNNIDNLSYNKLSPFDDRNKDKYVKKKNLPQDNINTLSRAISSSHNINYEINESFKNHSVNKLTNKDISNQRLNDISPLAKTSQIPIKTKTPPQITDEMDIFLSSYNTFKQSFNKL